METITPIDAEPVMPIHIEPASKAPLVIYHGSCRDGFCAAWVCERALREAKPVFFEATYGQPAPLPLIEGRNVLIVDFSYPLETMKEIAFAARSLLVLDHHKTAAEALAAFAAPETRPSNTVVVFDMNRSGAGLAWDHFALAQGTRPMIVDYVEDRDLWRHALPHSKEVNAYLSTLPFTFEAWTVAEELGVHRARSAGEFILGAIDQSVRESVKHARPVNFEGYEIPCINATHAISEVLNKLASEPILPAPFAMGWFQRKDGVFQYSLRSIGDFDVSALAKKYGGGGHKNAAGFQSNTLIV